MFSIAVRAKAVLGDGGGGGGPKNFPLGENIHVNYACIRLLSAGTCTFKSSSKGIRINHHKYPSLM